MSRIFKSMLERLAEYRRRQRAYDELYALDDRSLADIGISRGEIPGILARGLNEMASVPANQSGYRHAA